MQNEILLVRSIELKRSDEFLNQAGVLFDSIQPVAPFGLVTDHSNGVCIVEFFGYDTSG